MIIHRFPNEDRDTVNNFGTVMELVIADNVSVKRLQYTRYTWRNKVDMYEGHICSTDISNTSTIKKKMYRLSIFIFECLKQLPRNCSIIQAFLFALYFIGSHFISTKHLGFRDLPILITGNFSKPSMLVSVKRVNCSLLDLHLWLSHLGTPPYDLANILKIKLFHQRETHRLGFTIQSV